MSLVASRSPKANSRSGPLTEGRLDVFTVTRPHQSKPIRQTPTIQSTGHEGVDVTVDKLEEGDGQLHARANSAGTASSLASSSISELQLLLSQLLRSVIWLVGQMKGWR